MQSSFRELSALLLLMLLPAATFARDMPASWAEWKQSKQDARLVAEIEKAGLSICTEYGTSRRKDSDTRRFNAIRDYVLEKQDVNSIDLENVPKKSVTLRMSLCGALAAWGRPQRSNITETARGLHAQLVYSQRRSYVYADTDDSGKMFVTAVQH